jgi:hypothetical protein
MALAALIFIFSLPLGLAVTRTVINMNQEWAIAQFLGVTVGTTLLALLSRHLYRVLTTQSLQMLMHLLDESDRFNSIVQAIDVLDQLATVQNSQVSVSDRSQVLAALQITRDSLITGLMTERILRESRGLIARRHDLLTNIENNLTTLKTFEINDRANEYGEVLNSALQIGISVQKEVQALTQAR